MKHSDRAPAHINRARLTLAEQERLAYITGDTRTAELLGELLDAREAEAGAALQDDQIALLLAP